MMTIRIMVDRTLCDGNGMCSAEAPAYFMLNDDDQLEVLKDTVTAADLPAVRRGVAACPKAALALIE